MPTTRPKLLRIITLCGLLSVAALSLPAATLASKWPREVEKAFKNIKPKDCLEHVKVLASDAYEGRACGEEGGRKASEYIARAFDDMGLEPGGSIRGSYFQPFSVRTRRIEEGSFELSNQLRFAKKPGAKEDRYDFGKDFAPHPFSGEFHASGSLTFVGSQDALAIGDEGLEGQIAVVLRSSEPGTELSGTTADDSDDETDAPQFLEWPLVDALAEAGARGVLLVTDDKKFEPSAEAWKSSKIDRPSRIPVLVLSQKCGDRLIKKSGGSLKKLIAAPAKRVELTKGRVRFEASRRGFLFGRGRNVIGILRGSDPELSKECIVVGAHFDHVGYAKDPRLSRGKPGEIHNGADDNSSGTTGIIEMADAFCRSGVRPKRSIVFMTFDAEELGLLGSKYYAESPPVFPIDKTVCMINMDMISRNDPVKMYIGKLPDYAGLNRIVASVAGHFKIALDPTGMDKYIQRSDQWSFMEKGVPAVFLYGGDHPEYHTEKDDIKLANPNKIVNITRLMFLAAYECANHNGSFEK